MAENFEQGLFEATHDMTELWAGLYPDEVAEGLVKGVVHHVCGHTSEIWVRPDEHGAADIAELEDQPCDACEDKANDELIETYENHIHSDLCGPDNCPDFGNP
jgi:hypothetical protein